MHLAKSNGKARIAVYERHMYQDAVQRFEIQRELRRAIDRGEMVLHYQPIAAMETHQIIALEALVRWNHPVRGIIPPAEFIPVAETSRDILNLGRWVLHQACRDAMSFQNHAPDHQPLRIMVNVSGRQLAHDCIITDVRSALQQSGLSPCNLVLEVTESVFVRNTPATIARLWALKDLGILLAIDDFGTGYSSLAYLQRFPVDILKIDKSFTARLGNGTEESPLSRAVIALGSTLKLQTVVEGIETPEQWASLRALGCSHGQGFFIARPLPADEMATALVDLQAATLPARNT
jgi:EAL domain-containing protein (putative c-di-GMP-specific phosphodiesterase class I)